MSAPTAFKFEIQSDLGNVAQRLSQVHALLGDDKQRAKLMKDIATILENSTRKRFETKTDPDGNAWEGWSENTRKSKKYRERNESERLLRDSITSHASAQLAQVGSNKHYHRICNWGQNAWQSVHFSASAPPTAKTWAIY